MLTGLHILLTYRCLSECDHCFVYSGPNAEGTFTLAQLREALDQAERLGTITRVFFEGGEPFIYYPLLVQAVRDARSRGFEVGIVSNAYFATSREDARLALEPLADAGLTDITLSDDALHFGEVSETPARRALAAAAALGLPADTLSTAAPCVQVTASGPQLAGEVMFRGRAVEKLTAGLPRRPWESFTECPHEDLADPGRVHLDPYGNVHLCQGLLMGNIWKTPLERLVPAYTPSAHPIVAPLVRGGPAELMREFDLEHEAGYVDACHACYQARRALLESLPGAARAAAGVWDGVGRGAHATTKEGGPQAALLCFSSDSLHPGRPGPGACRPPIQRAGSRRRGERERRPHLRASPMSPVCGTLPCHRGGRAGTDLPSRRPTVSA